MFRERLALHKQVGIPTLDCASNRNSRHLLKAFRNNATRVILVLAILRVSRQPYAVNPQNPAAHPRNCYLNVVISARTGPFCDTYVTVCADGPDGRRARPEAKAVERDTRLQHCDDGKRGAKAEAARAIREPEARIELATYALRVRCSTD